MHRFFLFSSHRGCKSVGGSLATDGIILQPHTPGALQRADGFLSHTASRQPIDEQTRREGICVSPNIFPRVACRLEWVWWHVTIISATIVRGILDKEEERDVDLFSLVVTQDRTLLKMMLWKRN